PEPVMAEVPFSSRRRWSSLRLGGTSYVLGAPELFPLGPLAARATREAEAGRRVVAFGTSDPAPDPEAPPAGLRALGIVVLAERLRSDARETVAFFREQGVTLRVISGDRPEAVAAIAA